MSIKGDSKRDEPQIWKSLPNRILAASPHLQGESNPVDSRDCLNVTGKAFVEPSVDVRVEMARRYLVAGWQSFAKNPGIGWGIDKYLNHDEFKENLGNWNSLPNRILNATEHFKKCYIENDDAVSCIKRWATPHTAIYADPPYVDCEDYYAHNAKAGKDENLEMHYRLAEALNTVEAAGVVVSYYPNDLLDKLYPEADWERHYKDTVASSAGITRLSKSKKRPKRTELLLVRKKNVCTIDQNGQISMMLEY